MDFSSLDFNGSNTVQHFTGGNWHHMAGFSNATVSPTTFVLKEFNLVSPEAYLLHTIHVYKKAISPIVWCTTFQNSY